MAPGGDSGGHFLVAFDCPAGSSPARTNNCPAGSSPAWTNNGSSTSQHFLGILAAGKEPATDLHLDLRTAGFLALHLPTDEFTRRCEPSRQNAPTSTNLRISRDAAAARLGAVSAPCPNLAA
jgi:hypothetical protein